MPRENGAEEPSSLTQQFSTWLRSVLRGRGDSSLRAAIEELIEEEEGAGDGIVAEERILLSNILKLRDLTAADAMVPRADIVAVEIETSKEDLIARFSAEAHSRMPVYRETLDDIVGMVHFKDVLAHVAQNKPFALKDIVRDLMIVAPSISVLELLRQMRQSRQHMALVVDEFGGIDGLTTIEDLVEEIVGEIEDEHDEDDEPHLVRRADGSILADARLPIEDFEAEVGTVLDDEEREEIDTLGGLVVAMAGRVPARGEMMKHPSGLEFEILDADPRRIKRLRIRNIPPAAARAEA
jgi:CBS domain containing-hemolysin-like protein